MLRKCFTCYWWEPISSKSLEEKGFCYKEIALPEPRQRNSSCQDWSVEDKETPLFEI